MFEKYTYKQKLAALLVVFVLLSVTAYRRSFSTLFEVMGEYRTLSEKAADIKKKSKNANVLLREIAFLDNAIGKEGTNKQTVQQEIVGFATERHPGVSINDLQPIHVFQEADYTIVTNQLDVTGKANQLLQFGYDFEKAFRLSRPVSMNFYTTKKNNQSEILHLKIIFQNYENNQ